LRPRQGTLELDLNEWPVTRGDGCIVQDDADRSTILTESPINDSAQAGNDTILVAALDKSSQITMI
jgi:hypothetical protein